MRTWVHCFHFSDKCYNWSTDDANFSIIFFSYYKKKMTKKECLYSVVVVKILVISITALSHYLFVSMQTVNKIERWKINQRAQLLDWVCCVCKNRKFYKITKKCKNRYQNKLNKNEKIEREKSKQQQKRLIPIKHWKWN